MTNGHFVICQLVFKDSFLSRVAVSDSSLNQTVLCLLFVECLSQTDMYHLWLFHLFRLERFSQFGFMHRLSTNMGSTSQTDVNTHRHDISAFDSNGHIRAPAGSNLSGIGVSHETKGLFCIQGSSVQSVSLEDSSFGRTNFAANDGDSDAAPNSNPQSYRSLSPGLSSKGLPSTCIERKRSTVWEELVVDAHARFNSLVFFPWEAFGYFARTSGIARS